MTPVVGCHADLFASLDEPGHVVITIHEEKRGLALWWAKRSGLPQTVAREFSIPMRMADAFADRLTRVNMLLFAASKGHAR